MAQENINITMVRIAVAILESVFLIPILASIAVIPANIAEPNAYTTHIPYHFPLTCLFFQFNSPILPKIYMVSFTEIAHTDSYRHFHKLIGINDGLAGFYKSKGFSK